MKPTATELKQLQEMDERLTRFKEANWVRLNHPDPESMFALCAVYAVPLFGLALLLLHLLFEWFYRLFRMVRISIKASWLYSKLAFKKALDKFETKLFELWKKNI